jgi:methionine biosynthesis protein MetW
MTLTAKFHNKISTWNYPSGIEKIKYILHPSKLKNKKILDLGCGDGRFAEEIINVSNCTIYGLDSNKLAISEARRRKIKAKVYDIEKALPYDDQSFDVIFLLDTLEHLYNIDHIFCEIHRVLKKDGIIVVSFVNSFDLKNRILLLTGKEMMHWAHKKYHHRSWNNPHIRFPRVADVADLLKKYHLYIQKIQYNFNSAGIIPQRFTPRFMRKLILKLFPNLFSGKFVILASKRESKKIKNIYLDRTNVGL